MKRFKEFIKESLVDTYKELEFVCYNSDYNDSTNKETQKLFYKELKKLENETNNQILPYMQDFSDDEHEEFSLAVIILDKDNEQELENKIIQLSEKYNVEIDLYNERSDKVVDSIIRGEYYDNMIKENYEYYDIDKKLYLLKSYIRLLQNSEDSNKDLMIKYFIIIHNFLIIERLFYDDVKMCNKEINKYLELSKLDNVEDVEKKFYELYDSYNNVRYAVETLSSIEPIRIYLQENPTVFEKLMKNIK